MRDAMDAAMIGDELRRLEDLGLARFRRTALVFACGDGAVARALAAHYDRVVGVDAAKPTLRMARRQNHLGARCRYVVNRRAHLGCLEGEGFDLIHAGTALARIERHVALDFVREFLRFVTPHGVLLFALASEAGPDAGGRITAVPQAVVREILTASGARVVDAQDEPLEAGVRVVRYTAAPVV
jgi:ubiquinone/menaquinone biosynthesis C-methylase UbiE